MTAPPKPTAADLERWRAAEIEPHAKAQGVEPDASHGGPQVITLCEEDWDEFQRVMENPKGPTPSIIEAAKLMSELYANRPSTPASETGGHNTAAPVCVVDGLTWLDAARRKQLHEIRAHQWRTISDASFRWHYMDIALGIIDQAAARIARLEADRGDAYEWLNQLEDGFGDLFHENIEPQRLLDQLREQASAYFKSKQNRRTSLASSERATEGDVVATLIAWLDAEAQRHANAWRAETDPERKATLAGWSDATETAAKRARYLAKAVKP